MCAQQKDACMHEKDVCMHKNMCACMKNMCACMKKMCACMKLMRVCIKKVFERMKKVRLTIIIPLVHRSTLRCQTGYRQWSNIGNNVDPTAWGAFAEP